MSHLATSTFQPLNIAILTVSDTRTLETDTSGQTLADALLAAGHRLHQRSLKTDDIYQIRAVVSAWIADPKVQVGLITGGTGFTARDNTPGGRAAVRARCRGLRRTVPPGLAARDRHFHHPVAGAGRAQQRYPGVLPARLAGRLSHRLERDSPGATGQPHPPVQFRPAPEDPASRGAGGRLRVPLVSACACDGGQLRPLDEALAELLARAPRPPACESLALERALGRVLGEDLLAPMDLPHWDNSAMDGYALCSADLPRSGGSLTVGARIAAGDTRGMSLPLGQAARIFTGAPLPTGADCVVPQELCVVDGERVQLPPVSAGQHVRRRGEELRRGAPVLRAGQRLRPQELGLLASLGVATVSVRRRLRIGLLSSGDELREPGQTLLAGQIYNANRYCIGALLRGLGFEVHDEEVLADELVASRDALSLAASEWDALVTSGGVSVGEEDHLKRAIAELGEVNLWRLAIQPGKPFAFGSVAGKPWLGLPGNPAAALVTALLVARPFLLRQQGLFDVVPRPLALPAAFDWPQPRARRQYLRARLDERGRVEIHPQQGSAMLLAASWADGLAVIERGATLGVGDAIDFLPFSALMA